MGLVDLLLVGEKQYKFEEILPIYKIIEDDRKILKIIPNLFQMIRGGRGQGVGPAPQNIIPH